MSFGPGARRFQHGGPAQSIWSINPAPQPVNVPAPAPPPRSAPPPLSHLERASRTLLDMLIADAQAVPELADMLQSHPPIPYTSSTDKSFVPFYKKRTVEIPEGLFEYFDPNQQNGFLGIMPEIDRAWLAFGNKLFLWDYDAQDVSTFSDAPNVISHVSLVKPRPDIFNENVEHLVVICTPDNVMLIGLGCAPVAGTSSQQSRSQISLYATDMSIATDGNEMTGVVGTKSGRIFMHGRNDGSLYELVYRRSESWFTTKLQLVNRSSSGYSSFLPFFNKPDSDQLTALAIDDDRNCLYALSSQQTISLYSLGLSGEEFKHVKTLSGLRKSAQAMFPGLPALQVPDFDLKSIHVVDVDVARNIHLVAITNTGVRLYFSHYRRNPSGIGLYNTLGPNAPRIPQREPQDFDLIQVRPPPTDLIFSDTPAQLMGMPRMDASIVLNDLVTTHHSAGLTLGAQAASDVTGSDLIVCMAPDLAKIVNQPPQPVPPPGPYGSYVPFTPQRPPLTEYATALHVGGLTWAMAESRRPRHSSLPPSSPVPNSMFELATQFSEPPRQFSVFTNAGLTFFVKRRAVDHLKQLLETYDADPRPAQTFCQNFGRLESAAMLLAIACGNSYLDHDGADMPNSDDFSLTNVSADMSLNAKLLFYAQGSSPLLKANNMPGIGSETSIVFSGRRDGLALYFARVVRPIWRAQIVKKGAHGALESNVFDNTLVFVQKNLAALRSFLERNPTLFASSTEVRESSAQEAWKIELVSVAQLQGLLSQTVEAISFVLLLIDYRLSEIVGQCDQPTRDAILTLTYEELISTKKGRDAARGIVNAIINHQIAQQLSVDTISELLQQRCGSFCSADDVLMYKAIESIRKAKETRDTVERIQCLRTSYKFFAKGSAHMELGKLQDIVKEYKDLRFAKGAVDLPLKCAREWDADGLGRAFWVDGCPNNDPRIELYKKRIACYDLVVDTLAAFNSMYEVHANGPQTVEQEELSILRATGYQLAISSQDDVFHSYLYDWLMAKGMKDELVEIRTPYIEGYLRRTPITLERAELLHIFYVKMGQYLRAAETCAALAESTDFDVSLERRIQLFAFSVNYTKSHPSSETGRQEAAVEFLTDLEEKLEVAQVQLEIFNELYPRYGDGANNEGAAVRRLNSGLLTVTELYQEYAEPYNLLEIKLLILHISDYHEPARAVAIWTALFERSTGNDASVEDQVKNIGATVARLGQRFYPSEPAFPLEEIVMRLEEFALQRSSIVPQGWVPRVLLEGSVPFGDIFNILHKLYESQVPPFHVQANVQWLSGDVAILISDWVAEATRPQSTIPRREFPANLLDETTDLYMRELARDNVHTRQVFEKAKLAIRRNY